MFMDIARSKLIQVMMLTVSIAGCPAGYTRVTTTGCYRADPRTTWHGNHEDAEARCQESGGTLASLDSQEELDLVIDWLIQQELKLSGMAWGPQSAIITYNPLLWCVLVSQMSQS